MAEQQTANVVNGVDLDALRSTISALQQDPDLGQWKFRASNKWVGGTRNHTTIDIRIEPK